MKRVSFMHPVRGTAKEIATAWQYLNTGEVYTVQSTRDGNIYLTEVPGVAFRLEMFDGVP